MTTDILTAAEHGAVSADEAATASRRWAWWGVAAGVLGLVGTLVTISNVEHPTPDKVADLGSATFHIGGAVGYVCVAMLLVTAAAWRSRVARLLPRSIAARVVADGLTASAGALALGYGWKIALGGYLGPDSGLFDKNGLFVYFMLNDFSPWNIHCTSESSYAQIAAAENNVRFYMSGDNPKSIQGGTGAAVYGATPIGLRYHVLGIPPSF